MGICTSNTTTTTPPSTAAVQRGQRGRETQANPDASGGSRAHRSVVSPTDADHQGIELQFGVELEHNHEKNVNIRYNYMYTLDPTKSTGKGIKKTYGYIAKTDEEGILKKRKEFWETRVEGKKDTWEALKIAVNDEDVNNSLAILAAAGIKLIGKTLQMSYDSQGYKYDIPVFVINMPTSYESKPKFEIPQKNIELKIRIRQDEIDFKTNTFATGRETVDAIIKQYGKLEAEKTLRLFFGGKEIQYDDNKIGSVVNEDGVIMTFIKPK